MKKIIFLLMITSFGILGLAGCSKVNEALTNATAPSNTTKTNTAATNSTTTKTNEPAGNIMKPEDVIPDKAIKVFDLVDSVAAGGKDAWKGKEVTVTAYVSATANSGKMQTLTLLNDQTATSKKGASCTFEGEKPDVFGKTIEVKGKISYFSDGEYKSVSLDPCEIKK